jgi:mono/diheme cytochrome c family protein
MKVEMANSYVSKNGLSWIVLVVYLLMFGAGSWASSIVFPQTSLAQRWRPRRLPVGAELVGDRVCAQCHGDKTASHLKTGMALAMETIAESRVLTANPAMIFRIGNYTYEIKRKDKQSVYSVTDGKETISLPILYAFGEGKAGQTYILQYEGGLYESLVSFYNEISGLDFTIGAARGVPPSLKQALGRRLSDNEVSNCFSCHSTGGVSGGQLHLDRLTPGIRCEACHGPGGQHAAAGKAGEPNATLIFNPGRLSGDELSQDFCGSCHRGNDEFTLLKGMEINNVRFQPYRIFHSKCYSDDRRISCTACHDPHVALKQDAAHYDAKCLACHASKESSAGSKSSKETQALIPGCRVSTKDCTSCHMPKIGPPAAHFKFTDHYIRIARPREAYPN